MNDWSNKTGFLKFEKAYDDYWENVWISTNMYTILNINDAAMGNSIAGSSYVGYQLGINELKLTNGLSGNSLKRTTRHELGHAIGLMHEHQRWDRDDYVSFDGTGYDMNDKVNIAKIDKDVALYNYIEWRWQIVDYWTRWVYETRWVGGEWWQGGHWEGSWKGYQEPVYWWVANWVPYNVRNSFTPTQYDIYSIMNYNGIRLRKYSYMGKTYMQTLENYDISSLDAESVKIMYGR